MLMIFRWLNFFGYVVSLSAGLPVVSEAGAQ